MDDIVLFKPLRLEEVERIVDLQVNLLRKRLSERRIALTLTSEAKAFIAKEAYDPVYGARPLKRFLQRALETRIARELIKGEIVDGGTVSVGAGR